MQRKNKPLSMALLWLVAIIWGFAFVAQRKSMETMPPFFFNILRFALGSIVVATIIFFKNDFKIVLTKNNLRDGFFAGLVLFMGASLQQFGIVYTSAGKAGFITGTYVAFVPIIGLFLKQKIQLHKWAGIILVLVGLYLLTQKGAFTFQYGDIFLFVGAIFWALHIHIIDKTLHRNNFLQFALVQYMVCSVLSIFPTLFFEQPDFRSVGSTMIPLLYAGVLSVGIAYTVQIVAQRGVEPSIAAMIMSFETVFAWLGGWLILSETANTRDIIACLIMFSGIIVVQLNIPKYIGNLRKHRVT